MQAMCMFEGQHIPYGAPFDAYLRYQSVQERSLHKNMRELDRLQNERRKADKHVEIDEKKEQRAAAAEKRAQEKFEIYKAAGQKIIAIREKNKIARQLIELAKNSMPAQAG